MKDDILKLRSENKTYREISEILNISKSTVCYYLEDSQKDKIFKRNKEYRQNNTKVILGRKIYAFRISKSSSFVFKPSPNTRSIESKTYRLLSSKIRSFFKDRTLPKGYSTMPKLGSCSFSPEDIIKKGNKCYLTGRDIDFSKSRSYELDHIIPVSKGGESTLENCGVTCKAANQAKSDLSLEEFFQLCIDVVKHNNLKLE